MFSQTGGLARGGRGALDMVARARDAWLVHCISFRISAPEEAIWFYLEERKNLKQKYQSSWHIAHDSTRHGLGIFAALQTRQYEN